MDHDSQVKLRNAAAGLIKSLIQARASNDPDFGTQLVLRRWNIPEPGAETRSCAHLLNRVRQLRDRFEREFLAHQDSIPSPGAAEEAEQLDCLVDHVAAFICGDLETAIRAAVVGEAIDWKHLAAWNDLNWLRNALDRLPESTQADDERRKIVAKSEKVILRGLCDKPVVNGREKAPLRPKQYELIKKLIDAGDKRCSKTQLEKITTDFWKTLKRLKDSDSDWRDVIHFPGRSHGGYWID